MGKIIGIIIGILVLLFMAVGIWWFVLRTPSVAPHVPRTGPIVFLGDSLVAGEGATAGHDLPSLLGKNVSDPVLNYGVSGDTTARALARLEAPLSEKPQLAIILLGGNDFLQRVPAEQTFGNLKYIVQAFQGEGAQVLILGVRSGLLGAGKAEPEYEKVAKETHAEYISDVLSGLFGNSKYMSDSIHPNDAGYEKINARILPVIKKMLAD